MKHLQIEIARSDLASIPMTLQSHQTAYDITSNALYLFGGLINNFDNPSNSIYKWDITPNTWTTLSTTTPTIQDNIFYSFVNNAVTIQDVVYFIGMDDYLYDSGKVYRFRLSTEEWLSPDTISMPHSQHRQTPTHTLINYKYTMYLVIYGALRPLTYHRYRAKVGHVVIVMVSASICMFSVGKSQDLSPFTLTIFLNIIQTTNGRL
eukprot:413469_1